MRWGESDNPQDEEETMGQEARQVHHDQELVAAIAMVCHEANRAYCLTLGDRSQPAWADAPAWQIESVMAGVRSALDPIQVLSPEASHQLWMQRKHEEGWIYGPAKNPEKKEHPCMVPYEDLPMEQRRKDSLFLAIVRALT